MHLLTTCRPWRINRRLHNRVVRIPDELWDEARVIADERGETMSEYVRRLIREDVRRWPIRMDPGC